VCSIVGAEQDKRLQGHLTNLRGGVENLIQRLAQEIPKNERTIFLINNYNLIITLCKDKEKEGAVPNEDVAHLVTLLEEQEKSFVDEELNAYFSRLVAFVRDVDEQLRSTPEPKIDKLVVDSFKGVYLKASIIFDSIFSQNASLFEIGIFLNGRDSPILN